MHGAGEDVDSTSPINSFSSCPFSTKVKGASEKHHAQKPYVYKNSIS